MFYHACILTTREPQQSSLFQISNSDNYVMTRWKRYFWPNPQNTSCLHCSEDFRSCSKMGLFELTIRPQCVGRLVLLLMQELQPAMKIQLRCSQPNKQHVEKKKTKTKRLMIRRCANICKIILHIGYVHMFDFFSGL